MTRAEGPRSPAWWLVLGVAGALYAAGVAATDPFTGPADVLTALPLVAFVVLAIAWWPARPTPWHPEGMHPLLPWSVWAVLVVAWEVVEYAARGARRLHPTLSSMADALDRHAVLKAVVVFGWLCLGLAIVVAGRAGRGERRS